MATKEDDASGEHYRGDEAFSHRPKLIEPKRRPSGLEAIAGVLVYPNAGVVVSKITQRSGGMLVHKLRWIYL